MTHPCLCGHIRAAHMHDRTGSDCKLCGPALCARYRPVRWWHTWTVPR